MPSVNLRLSGAEHEELVLAARENARSLQREIVWRLFGGGLGAGEPGAATSPVAAVEVPRSASADVRSPAPAPSPSFPVSVKQFKGPDPKGGKK